MTPTPAYILAGGHSSRFGSDKAHAVISGQPLILHVASFLKPFAESITVVADRTDKYADLGLRTIADDQPHLGPLGGLEAILRDCSQSELALVTSCDILFLDAGRALRRLLAEAKSEDLALVYRTERWHPFPGLYNRLLLPGISERLRTDDRSLRSLLDHSARALECEPFTAWAADANTPEDLARAIKPEQG